jgi:Uma2 family endonuclease
MLQRVTDQQDPPRRRATYQDVIDAPEHMVAEIIDGELYTWPRPAPRHAVSATSIGGQLYAPYQIGQNGPGGWSILNEPELHFDEDVVVPDLAGWRDTRLPTIPETPYFTLAPDWLCEVLSPSTARIDRGRKLAIYARERVTHVWLVDSLVKTLEVLVLGVNGWTVRAVHHGDDRIRAVPFDAIELDLSALWRKTTNAATTDARPDTTR